MWYVRYGTIPGDIMLVAFATYGSVFLLTVALFIFFNMLPSIVVVMRRATNIESLGYWPFAAAYIVFYLVVIRHLILI